MSGGVFWPEDQLNIVAGGCKYLLLYALGTLVLGWVQYALGTLVLGMVQYAVGTIVVMKVSLNKLCYHPLPRFQPTSQNPN